MAADQLLKSRLVTLPNFMNKISVGFLQSALLREVRRCDAFALCMSRAASSDYSCHRGKLPDRLPTAAGAPVEPHPGFAQTDGTGPSRHIRFFIEVATIPIMSETVVHYSTPARRRPSLDFSITGLVYCCMLMFMGLAAMNTQANLLFGVFGLMIGILIVSGVVSRIVLRRLRIHRNIPQRGAVGEPMTVFYEITNQKRYWPSLSITVAELDGVDGFNRQPYCYMLHAAARMTASVPIAITPLRRGLHEFNHYQLSTSFPFGFIKRAVIDQQSESLCIFPAIAEVDSAVIAMCRSADNMGESSRPRAGGTDEFFGVREYRPGDNPRHIYWRRSARTGVLVSKDMTRVSPPRIMIVVDTFLANPTLEALARVERAIAMAGSLASAALAQDLSVGVCAWAGQRAMIAPTRGKQQRDEILTLLARLPANSTLDVGDLLSTSHWLLKSGTTIALFTAGNYQPCATDPVRSGVVILSAADPAVAALFRFGPEVQFDVGAQWILNGGVKQDTAAKTTGFYRWFTRRPRNAGLAGAAPASENGAPVAGGDSGRVLVNRSPESGRSTAPGAAAEGPARVKSSAVVPMDALATPGAKDHV